VKRISLLFYFLFFGALCFFFESFIWNCSGAKLMEQAMCFDTIRGVLPDVIKKQEKPYYLIADIEVPAGRTVNVEPGVVFLFKNFTGLHIEGKLLVNGTREEQVIFTSEYDRHYAVNSPLIANPYDWNGIYIHDQAFGTMLINCKITYTVYGLISDTRFIRLDNVMFDENGKSDLMIEGSEHKTGNKPYSYNLTIQDVKKDGVPVIILKDPLIPKRAFFRYSGLALGIGGGCIGIYGALQLKDSYTLWKKFNDKSDTSWMAFENSDIYYKSRDKYKRDFILTAGSFGLAIIGFIGFTWSFTF